MSEKVTLDERAYLKVKIKSLAAEAKIIREETKRARCPSIKNGLYRHRIDVVRVEARHTHLAYGFLRGRTYHQIEKKAEVVPNWAKVRKMVEKYGSHTEPWTVAEGYAAYEKKCADAKAHLVETLKRFDEWMAAAKTELPQ